MGADSNLLFNAYEEGLERVKVKENGLFRSVSDDFLVAKRRGRLLLFDGDEEDHEEMPDGSCDVHFTNLHSRLSLSLSTRSSGGNEINRWAPLQKF